MVKPASSQVDLNTATEDQLARSLGISIRLARRMVAMRPFTSLDDLAKVWGLDEEEQKRIRARVTLAKEEKAEPLLPPPAPVQVSVEPSEPQNLEPPPQTPFTTQQPAPDLPIPGDTLPPETTSELPDSQQIIPAATPSVLVQDKARRSLSWKAILPIAAILVIGAFFRFVGLNWDQNQHQHPDERFLTMVEDQIKPVALVDYFNTEISTLNPFQNGASYTYGMLPLFLTRFVSGWLGMSDYDKVVLVGRFLSGLFDLLAVLGLYFLAVRLFNRRVGLLAAGLGVAAVLPIQLSHYFTVDSFSTVFIVVGFILTYLAVPILSVDILPGRKHLIYYALFGLVVGAAMACKINTAPLFGIIVLAGAAVLISLRKQQKQFKEALKYILIGCVIAGVATIIAFRILQPYAFEGPGFFGLSLNPRWLAVMHEVTGQVAGKSDWPPNDHWTSRSITYALTNMVEWGMGLPLGLAACLGLLWAAWRCIKGDWRRLLVPVVWVVGYFGWQNMQFWRYMRYFMPIYPILILLAAWGLVDLLERTKQSRARMQNTFRTQALRQWAWKPMLPGLLGSLAVLVVVAGTYIYAIAFVGIYTRPITRVDASRWILANILGPINVKVATGSTTQTYPIGAPSNQAFYTDDTFTSSFLPTQTGVASSITTTRVSLALAAIHIKISKDKDGNDVLTEGNLIVPSSTPDKLQTISFGDTSLEAGTTYYLIYAVKTGGTVSAGGAVLRTENDEDPTLPVDWSLSAQGPVDQENVVAFTPATAMHVDQLQLQDFQGTVQASPVTLKFTLSDNSDANNVLATTQATTTIGTSDQPVTPEFTFSPVTLTAGKKYYVHYQVISGGPVVFAAEPFTLETGWDDYLPLSVDGYDALGTIYSPTDLQLYDPDTTAKRDRMIEVLNSSDYIVIPSNRAYDAMPRLPLRYPLALKYYQALFDCNCSGDAMEAKAYSLQAPFHSPLGFDLVATFTSNPSIGPFSISDQSADESFTVYDHPKVLIFKKSADFSIDKVRALLDSVDLSNVIQQAPAEVGMNPTNYQLPLDRLAAQVAGGTWSTLFNVQSALNNNQALGAVAWYLIIFLLGLGFFPMAFLIFRGFSDRGYALARLLGLLAVAWLVWILASLKLVPFTDPALWGVVVIFMLVNGGLAWRSRQEIRTFFRARWRYVLGVEGLFALLFVFSLILRLNNPDLWQPWMGGEKPMDFSIFNAVLKTVYFPPANPWYAGDYLNYYYYGMVIAAIPTRLLGILPSIAYNLVIPTWFALTGVGIFGLVYNAVSSLLPDLLEKAARAGRELAPKLLNRYALLAGCLAVVLMLFLGNLFQVGQLWQYLPTVNGQDATTVPQGLGRIGPVISGAFQVIFGGASLPGPASRWYFEASRPIVPNTPDTPIAEFPLFTFLFADLHPHLLTMPFMFVALAWMLNYYLTRKQRKGIFWQVGIWFSAGLVLGMFRPAHTWDYPTFLGLAALTIAWTTWSNSGHSLTKQAVRSFLIDIVLLGATATLMYFPFGQWFATGYNSLTLWTGLRTPLGDYLTVHGVFLFILISFMLVESYPWIKAHFTRWKAHPLAWLAFDRKTLIILASLVVIYLAIIFLWGSDLQVFVLVVPVLVWMVALLRRKDQPVLKQAVLVLFGLALLMTLAVELVVLQGDSGRSNMVFYFYIQVWALFSVGASILLVLLLIAARDWRPPVRWSWSGALALLVLSAALYPLTAIPTRLKDRWPNIANPPLTLDGMAYMLGESTAPGATPANPAIYNDNDRLFDLSTDYAGIMYMLQNVTGTPTIVEGQTEEYRWGSRFSVYTGLPTVVGWSWHTRQHYDLMDGAQVDARIAEVKAFYETTDVADAMTFIEKYQVKYIIVGDLEKAYYPGDGLNKFQQMVQQGELKVFFSKVSGSSVLTIYQVVLN